MIRSGSAAVLVTLTALVAGHAAAQERDPRDAQPVTDPASRREARALFEEAVDELRRGHFPGARDRLRRSLDLYPTAGTAFNLALALNGMGETGEAVAVLAALLDGAQGELDGRQRSEVEALLRRARADLARLLVTLEGPGRARVRVDGEAVGEVTPEAPLEVIVDAGRHLVDATAEGFRPAEQVVSIGRGQRATAALRLEPEPLARAAAGGAAREEEGGGVLRSPWTWVVVGALVLGGGAAVFLATRDRTGEPVRDPVFGIGEVLRWP